MSIEFTGKCPACGAEYSKSEYDMGSVCSKCYWNPATNEQIDEHAYSNRR